MHFKLKDTHFKHIFMISLKEQFLAYFSQLDVSAVNVLNIYVSINAVKLSVISHINI